MVRQVLAYTWELPQTLYGWILAGYYWITGQVDSFFWDHDILHFVVNSKKFTAISCGGIVIISSVYHRYDLFDVIKKHEYGHSRQSLFLGPFYFVVVGIPSLLNSLYWYLFPPEIVSQAMEYRDFWIEKWADELGGITPFDRKKIFLFYAAHLP